MRTLKDLLKRLLCWALLLALLVLAAAGTVLGVQGYLRLSSLLGPSSSQSSPLVRLHSTPDCQPG